MKISNKAVPHVHGQTKADAMKGVSSLLKVILLSCLGGLLGALLLTSFQ
jgi:uncharacterized protein with ACT and thioredoxin-like domain